MVLAWQAAIFLLLVLQMAKESQFHDQALS